MNDFPYSQPGDTKGITGAHRSPTKAPVERPRTDFPDTQLVKILLIEDDPDDVWALRSRLADRWDGPYELIHVKFLSEALECCALGEIEVVLLDLSLSDGLGLETFLTLYARHGQIPIIVLADVNDETLAMKAVQAGAEDYLVKSQMSDRLLVRSIRYGIERRRRRKAEQTLESRSGEIRAAQEIQRHLAPTGPPSCAGFDIAGVLVPAQAAAGDYYDHFRLSDGSLGLVLGDVSSQGVEPTLVMAETRACLRTLAQTFCDVGEILSRTNRFLTSDIEQLHFVTMALLRLDPKKRSLTYAGAGQRGYLIDPGKRKPIVLDSTCPPLGINQEMAVPTAPPLALQPRQVVAFFSDGVAGALSADRRRFGVRRALELLRDKAGLSARQIVDELRTAVEQFCRPEPIRDDITAVIVKVDADA